MANPAEGMTPIQAIDLKFTSGNGVPVESARVTAEEWEAVVDDLREKKLRIRQLEEGYAQIRDRNERMRTQLEETQARLRECEIQGDETPPAAIQIIRELVEALENIVKRVEINGGIGEYKGGPVFVMSNARKAIASARKVML